MLDEHEPTNTRHPRQRSKPGGYAAAAGLAPLVAAIVVWALNRVLPNVDPDLDLKIYPLVLEATFVAALVFGVAGWLWKGFQPTARSYGPLWTAAICLVCVWDLATTKWALLPMPYFPGPELVLQGLIDDRWILLESAVSSLKLVLSGYVLGVLAGLASGVLMGWFKQARYWGMPMMKVVGPIPATAFVPLAMLAFDDAFLSGIALIGLAVWFPVTMLTISGIANVPSSYFDVARTLGAKPGYLIFRVALPAAMPSVFIGLFMGMGAAFLTLVVAETVGVRSGLGWYFKMQKDYFEYAKVYAALFIMAVFFSGLMTLLFKVRDRVLGWQKGVIRW